MLVTDDMVLNSRRRYQRATENFLDPVLLIQELEFAGTEDAPVLSAEDLAPTLINDFPWHPVASYDGKVMAGRFEGSPQLLGMYRWDAGANLYVNAPITGYVQGYASSAVWHECISANGDWVLATSFANYGVYAYKYNGVDGYDHMSFTGTTYQTQGVAFSPDETQVAVSYRNGNCTRFDFNSVTGAMTNPVSMPSPTGNLGWDFVDWVGGYIMLSGGESLRILDASSMVTITEIACPNYHVRAYFSADGAYVYYFHKSYSWNGSALTLLNTYTTVGTGDFEFNAANSLRTHMFFLNHGGGTDLYRLEGPNMVALTPLPAGNERNNALWTNLP